MKRGISFVVAAVVMTLVGEFTFVKAQADQKIMAKADGGDTKAMCILAKAYENGAGVAIDSAQALKWLIKAADMGCGDAAISLSYYYLKGTLVPKDTARCLAIRQEWANKKLPDGIATLGQSYLYGLGVSPDTVLALELLRQADEKGSGLASSFWGTVYTFGEYGYKKDYKQAEKHFLKSIKRGCDDGYSDLSYFYAIREDYQKCWKYLNEAIRKGHRFARTFEAQLRFNGHGVERDEVLATRLIDAVLADYPNYKYALAKGGQIHILASNPSLRDSLAAVKLWKHGADLGSNECRYFLVELYVNANQMDTALATLQAIVDDKDDDMYEGDACLVAGNIWRYSDKSDAERALEWYHLGVDKYKSPECAKALASYYAETEEADEYGPGNLVMSYYMKAVELGDTSALVDYGRYCAYNGDLEHAEEAFAKMVKYGDYDGYYWLAALYGNQDEQKALQCLKDGDAKGNAVCRESLGRLYEEGYMGGPDYKKAEKYYLAAATPSAYNQLGALYLGGALGKQSPKDIQLGLSYLGKAADMGNTDAINRMGYIYETGSYVDSVDHVKALSYYSMLAKAGNANGLFKMGLYYELGDGGVGPDSVKALEYYRRAADMGHGEAMCYLGDFYRIGQYMPLDRKEAFKFYSMADSLGSYWGTYYVGRSYLEGCGVDVDSAAAIPYLKAAAANGIGRAAFLLGEFYNYGKGSLADDGDSAMHYYVVAYQSGNADATYYIGVKLYEEEEYEQSFNLINKAAQSGNRDAIFRLAAYLQDGIGVKADAEQAYKLFELSAQRYSMAAAYTQMGLARLQGNGCRQDELLGKLYLDTATALGSNAGMFYLAVCLINGYGCDPDTVEADRLLVKSAEMGYVRAMNLLGDRYEENEDFDNAVRYFQMAADRGSWDGLCNLGYCYEKGHGVILSFKKAAEYYRIAADLGSPRGMRMLANCYLEGIGVEKDVDKVIELLERASSTGDVQAMYYLGLLYEEGEDDFPKDKKKAKAWIKKAADAGFQPAQTALSRF